MAEEDMLSRMTTNVSPTSTTKPKKVKIREAPMTQAPIQSKRTFCDKHPKVCKAGRVAGTGAALAGLGVLTMAAAGEVAAEKAVNGIMWLGENTYPDKEPTTTTVKKSGTAKKRTTAKKKSATASRKTATRKKTVKANNSSSKRKTASKRKTTRKKSNKRTSYVANPDYWRL